jgi:Tfp pilus assembly protein PilX
MIIANTRNKTSQSGSIVLMALLILSSVVTIVLVASSLAIQGIKASRNQEYSAIAYFAAESGAERILLENRRKGYEFKKTPDDSQYCADGDCISFIASPMGCVDCSDSSKNNTLNNGANYYVKYISRDPDGTVFLLSTGWFQNVSRSVEISYKY